MKRKVVLHGPSTLTVSLPSLWVRKFGIKKGDELSVEVSGNGLRIETEKEPELEKKEINIGDFERLGVTYVTSTYRKGFNEVDLLYSNKNYIKNIEDTLSKELTGFEIIKQEKNSCIVRDLTGHNKDEFNSALRRTWLLLIGLAEEGLEAFKEKDTSRLKSVELMDSSINKLSNYCLRLLTKTGKYPDHDKVHLYYYLIKNLEQIGDQYKRFCTFYSEKVDEIDSNLTSIFSDVNGQLQDLYELFYKYDERKIENLFKKTKQSCKAMYDLKRRVPYNLYYVCDNIKNLLSTLVEMRL